MPASELQVNQANMAHMNAPLLNIKARIERLDKLPPMPEMTQKILQLNANPDAHLTGLFFAAVIVGGMSVSTVFTLLLLPSL